MGLLDLTREVVTEYKADVSDMKAKLKEVDAAEREMAEHELEQAKARNEHADSFLEKLAKVGLAITAVKEIGEVIWDGYKDGVKDARLATQAMGVDLEKLQEATKGLITENQLLEFAAKANRSAFKNSQEDIENAGKAIVALEHRGVDAAEAMDAVTRALVEGKTRGLEPYGVVVDKHIQDLQALGEENLTVAQKTEIHTRAMEGLKTMAGEVSDSQDGVGDSMQRSQVKLANAWDDIKKELGQLAIAFEPVIAALAAVLNLAKKIAELGGTGGNLDQAAEYYKSLAKGTLHSGSAIDVVQDTMTRYNQWQPGFDRAGAVAQDLGRRFQDYYVDASTIDIDKTEWKRDDAAEKKAAEAALALAAQAILRGAGNDASFKSLSAFDSGSSKFRTHAATGAVGGAYEYGATAVDVAGLGSSIDLGADIDLISKRRAFESKTGEHLETWSKDDQRGFDVAAGASSMKETLDYAQQFLNKKTDSALEKVFGKVGDFELYKKGFQALTGAAASMYDAIVTGSESAGTAFRKSVGAFVGALGKQMTVEAVKQGAYAIAELFGPDPAAAAGHAAAAAEFLAGAALAGTIASELGYGSSGGGGGSSSRSSGGGSSAGAAGGSSSGGGSSGGGGDSGGGQRVIYVYGDSYANDSPRMRQVRAEREISKVFGTSAVVFS